jgi:hypothetical protein
MKIELGADKYTTRHGWPVRVICVDVINDGEPVFAFATDPRDGQEVGKYYRSDGRYCIGERESEWDLIPIPVKPQYAWVSIYVNEEGNLWCYKISPSKEEAMERAGRAANYVRTKRINLSEDDET